MKKRKKGKIKHPIAVIALLFVAILLALISSDAIHGRWARHKTIFVSGSYVAVNDALRLNRFSESDFSRDASGRVRYLKGAYRTGVDVSLFQDEIDWARVAGDGIDFAMVRAGSRSYSTGALRQDKLMVQNVKGAAAAGLDVGVYFFSQAISTEEAVEEATYLLELLKDLPVTLPVVFDWEQVDADLDENGISRTNDVDASVVTDCAVAFLRQVEAAGYQGMLYCNGMTGYFTYDLSKLQDYPIWYASYSTTWPNFYYGVDLWQYSDSGTVAGISGTVDLNILPIETDPLDSPLRTGRADASRPAAESSAPADPPKAEERSGAKS